ncbi:hypothetical protein CQW23_29104 [Capsicum baccatum]|uniref:Uncharacterized protein n=1 Tax=Capsicum baccatum TaxID=33114 RepID=A0A2G2VIH9_CAPBA|nr:hypothetical protein CQW23_29104 [Capsicum baccatum]
MERKLQEEREQMATDLKRDMDQDLQKKLEEEHEHMKGEVEKMFQEKMAALMAGMQQLCFRYSMESIFERCNGSTKSSEPTSADNNQPQPEVKVLNQDLSEISEFEYGVEVDGNWTWFYS